MPVISRDYFSGLEQAGQLCADYLSRHIRVNGSFEYEIFGRTGATTTRYNILRHAGAIYAFSQWQNLHGAGQNADWMKMPVEFLKAHARTLEFAGKLSCIVEGDEVKLGGTSLALLAMIERYKLHPTRRDMVWMRRFAEFIVWMQLPDGKFYSKFFYDKKRFSEFESNYYPGEAMLSLIRFYRLDADARWLRGAVAGAEYLLSHPVAGRTGGRGHNHWFAMALSELLVLMPRQDLYDEFWLIADATIRMARQQIDSMASSASVATFGETIAAALGLDLRRNRPSRVDELLELLVEILGYCLRLQVGDGQGFSEYAKGGIMERPGRDRIRIDFVQHTLQVISGLLRMQAAIEISH